MPGDDSEGLEALGVLLAAANRLARDLRENALLSRLLDVFARMPEGDREPLLGVLEREVDTRLVSQEVADALTQVELRPNPNARLYLRVIEPEPKGDEVEMLAFLRAAYSVQRGVDALDPYWRRMIVTALRQMDPEALERIDGFNRVIRTMLEEAASEQVAPPGQAAPPHAPAEPPPPVGHDRSSRTGK